MHELLLFGQIPAARHEQLLNILAGLAAMQPQRVLERHVLFKPTRIPQAAGPARGGSQGVVSQKQNQQAVRNANTDVFHLELVKALSELEFGKGSESMEVDATVTEQEGHWELRFKDTPQPGKRPTILRSAETIEIKSGDPQAYVEALGYTVLNQTVVEGHRFILDNIILCLHRIMTLPTPIQSINDPLPAVSSLVPLDKSGSYVLEAKVRIAESNPSLISRAEQELAAFQTRMRGVIDLVVPERLALDTRALHVRPRLGTAAQGNSAQARG
ncbi:hypothetical protein, variant [Verruconis gallopava]|uniref:Mediator of RNA polymerase II transcription subunit 18 n=1 Tax=Verruconis gallopava TaxID=253628 RepID=A0A0D1YX86_9PEZI|nr:uncharacterized protein PV09_03844 [Verruconis gallopava]XP_016215192.1 hypothetical protein, variant [Verruconis gallopava]KIW05322.1 hypothetical protein PV09_03844 [Verruconis gallopava]KIW05323.1 hypothetical protein, variant [Verruconis gallopava]